MNNAQTTGLSYDAPWHRESFDKFIHEYLPQLLAQRLPLTGYEAVSQDADTCVIRVSVNDIEVEYRIVQPDEDGLFHIDGKPYVVVPVASSEHLDQAVIKCVGEQLFEYMETRLGEAAAGLPWDEALVMAWLPLDTWVQEVVASNPDLSACWGTGQPLDTSNGTAIRTHLRRIIIPEIEKVVTPGQFGRVCPFEVPEGPNIGHIFSVALGAVIRDNRLEIVEDSPVGALGLTASMVPFLEHNDPNRLTFGVNRMHQWLIPPDPEPAIVQTGYEPDAPGIWCGRNLLTAFISYGADTYEDAIVISESAAEKLGYVHPLQPGDKLSNRHGTKGVVSRILPDDQMPHLPDGTPVELVYSFVALHTRLNFGQIREALMGRIAQAEGQTVVVQPFSAPKEDELRERAKNAGLPEDGMETLTLGRNGRKLERRSMVGPVYWGKTNHLSSYKIRACLFGPRCNMQSELDFYNLRDMGCFETIDNHFNTCSNDRTDAEQLVQAVAKGAVEKSGAPSPKFLSLQKRLAIAGIKAELSESAFLLKLAPPPGKTLKLAIPVQHPWLREHKLTEIGTVEDLLGDTAVAVTDRWISKPGSNIQELVSIFETVVKANSKLERVINTGAPKSLECNAKADLENSIRMFFDALVTPDNLRMGNQVMFGGRAVLAPGSRLQLDQLGLAEEIAWTIFGPLIIREMGDASQVESRTEEATHVLDEIMARSWVVLNRAPSIIPTATMAFHPVRIPEPVIRIHPLVCFLMNADFDGDQAAVFLPVTEAAQREAGEKLSFAGHLRRDPNLYGLTFLTHEVLWGLAKLSLTQEGLDEISKAAGISIPAKGIVDRAAMADALKTVMQTRGVDAVIETMQRLMELGFRVTVESGASLSPFVGSSIALPPKPEGSDPDVWRAYYEEAVDVLQSISDFNSPDIGPQLLAVKSGARGTIAHLLRLVAPSRFAKDAAGREIPLTLGLRDGSTSEELFANAAGARQGLAEISYSLTQQGYGVREASGPKGFGVLARAMRSSQPGPVFARAAATGEVDPLTDLDSRLFVGMRAGLSYEDWGGMSCK